VKALTTATAPKIVGSIETGRMIETFGKFVELMNGQGSGMVVFRGKRGDYLKILTWDGSGLCLFAKLCAGPGPLALSAVRL
jgi:hypothetical protein